MMAELRVLCGDADPPGPAANALRLALQGPHQTFCLQIEDIRNATATPIPDRLVDLLEIAAYVLAADRSIGRGGKVRQNWGEAWSRNLTFTIPVRDLEFWQRDQVHDALCQALGFVSDDVYRFAFVQAQRATPLEDYLPLAENAQDVFPADEVMLLSGGTDSLAGAVETLATTDRHLVLVSHRSSPKTRAFMRDLASELQRRYPQRVYAIPVYAGRTGVGEAREQTQRSRSFFYAALGFVIAQMFGAERLRFWDNGVVSANLPINNAIVGTLATRTTHPYTLRLFRTFLSLVADAPVDLDNPAIWRTRTEMLTGLAEHGAADLIGRSVSCSNVHHMAKPASHCGVCSQCLDRRFSVLAAGLAERDPANRYEVDLLRGARTSERDQTMAVDYTRHWSRMADVSDAELIGRFGGELTRLTEGFPDRPASDIADRFHNLFQRQGKAVRNVLGQAIAEASHELAAGSLPETCLLRLHVGWPSPSAAEPLPPEPETITPLSEPTPQTAPEPHTFSRPSGSPLPLQIELSTNPNKARILDVTDVSGRTVALIRALKAQHDEDLEGGLRREAHAYVHPLELSDMLGLEDPEHVRQLVKRARGTVRSSLEAIGIPLGHDEPLIERQRTLGYRLNPEVRFVSPVED